MNNNPENNGTQLQEQPAVQEQTPMQAPLSMGWYKFLVYFALWASALVNISNAGNVMSGNIYTMQGINPELAYSMFDSLKGFDTFRGILFIACAIFGIATAVSLLKHKSSGPKLLLALYGCNLIVSVISYVGEYSIVNAVTPIELDVASLIPNIIVCIVMLIINKVYFDKRAHLFNN